MLMVGTRYELATHPLLWARVSHAEACQERERDQDQDQVRTGTISQTLYSEANTHTHTAKSRPPSKADHIPLVGHLRILENHVSFCSILWPADQGGIATEVCVFVPNSQREASTGESQPPRRRASRFSNPSQALCRRLASGGSHRVCSARLSAEKWEVLLGGVGTLRYYFPPNASVQWQPGDLTIHTSKCFLGARFPRSTSPSLLSLRSSAEAVSRPGRARRGCARQWERLRGGGRRRRQRARCGVSRTYVTYLPIEYHIQPSFTDVCSTVTWSAIHQSIISSLLARICSQAARQAARLAGSLLARCNLNVSS